MLVRITDIKNRTYWINPLYVKAVGTPRPGLTEIYIAFGTGWGNNISVIKVDAPPEHVAEAISAAMPGYSAEAYAAAVMDEEQLRQQQQQAAAAAAASAG